MISQQTVAQRMHRRPGQRTGLIGFVLLVMLAVILTIMALAINIGLLACVQAHMNGAVEAAVLAGAAELIDPTPSIAPDVDDAEQRLAQEQRILVAMEQAAHFARASGVCVRIRADDLANDAECASTDDAIVGWVDDPTSRLSPLQPYDGNGPVNAIEIRATRSNRGRDAVPLWLGRALGLPKAKMNVMARAAVDQRVYGFRPAGHVNVPLAPLTMFANGSANIVTTTEVGFSGEGQDQYSVDVRHEEVIGGPDGIAEVVLRIGQDDSSQDAAPRNASLFQVPGSYVTADDWSHQILWGFNGADLAAVGGELAPNADGLLPVVLRPEPTAGELAAVQKALLAVRGKKRIWPVAVVEDEACFIVSFAAGTVVDCRRDGAQLVVTWQPCSLQTPTALTGPGFGHNRWIGKIMLIR